MAGDRGEVLNKGSDGTPVPMWAFEARFADLERLLTERDRRYMERMAGIEQHSLDRDLSHRREVQQLLTERDRFLAAAFASSEAAIGKADISTEKRFESVNEFRAQLKDQQLDFVSRTYYEAQHSGHERELQAIQLALKDQIPRVEANTIIAGLESGTESLRKEVAALRESQSSTAGGSAALWRAATFAVSVIAVLTAIYLIVH